MLRAVAAGQGADMILFYMSMSHPSKNLDVASTNALETLQVSRAVADTMSEFWSECDINV